MARNKDLTLSIKTIFNQKMAIGESRHQAKQENTAQDKIFSYKTRDIYENKCSQFAKYCQDNYNCKSLAQCEKHINDYIRYLRQEETDKNGNFKETKASAYSQKTTLSAIGKLYGKSYFNEIKTDARDRSDIIRGRTETESRNHFSEKNNHELVNFCKNTGLRRSELLVLKGKDLVYANGKYNINVENGKGGKHRLVPILNQNQGVIDKMQSVGKEERVFLHIHSKAPIHEYRGDYAKSMYQSLARPIEELHGHDRYCCRGDMKGEVYDRQALFETSQALGHERETVIVSHYLY